ncbi:MAG: hypothetical protein M0006_04010 [Magnetospirillum sp.]|nr:hypothetical protein [Magnetospirillum sp.]
MAHSIAFASRCKHRDTRGWISMDEDVVRMMAYEQALTASRRVALVLRDMMHALAVTVH